MWCGHKMFEETIGEWGYYLLIVGAYAALGAGMKYADQAFDLGVFSKKTATFLAIPGAILMGLLMVVNHSSATIFLAIVLAVAITSKIDNIAFQAGVVVLILVPLVFREYVQIQWLPFGILILSGLADEYGNDWSDRQIKRRHAVTANGGRYRNTPAKRFFEVLFQHRPTMKLSLLALTIAGIFHFIYFIAFLAFDEAYKLMEKYSFSIKEYHISRAAPAPAKNKIKGLEDI